MVTVCAQEELVELAKEHNIGVVSRKRVLSEARGLRESMDLEEVVAGIVVGVGEGEQLQLLPAMRARDSAEYTAAKHEARAAVEQTRAAAEEEARAAEEDARTLRRTASKAESAASRAESTRLAQEAEQKLLEAERVPTHCLPTAFHCLPTAFLVHCHCRSLHFRYLSLPFHQVAAARLAEADKLVKVKLAEAERQTAEAAQLAAAKIAEADRHAKVRPNPHRCV